jgi:Rps23 Pro-64 3,4-dihydroxylase Tpa1-like proline 4-hydroxylase
MESIDYTYWNKRVSELAAEYRVAKPFPHIALDNFLVEEAAEKALEVFPKVKDEGWIHYVHVNERKHGLNKLDLIPAKIREVIKELNSPEFLEFLQKLTGIDGLLPDDSFEGGGIHQTERNGFLNIHADFTVHPHKRNWKRRVNVLVYLNKDWLPEYKGDLELWDENMKECQSRIAPIFNRVVVFNTDEKSYHGLPEPIACPEGVTRKSLALYYFTEEKSAPRLRTTNYQPRPGDGARSILINLDKFAISSYTRVKRALGLNDDFASKVLNIFSGKKKGK